MLVQNGVSRDTRSTIQSTRSLFVVLSCSTLWTVLHGLYYFETVSSKDLETDFNFIRSLNRACCESNTAKYEQLEREK